MIHKPIPISAAKEIAEKYGYEQVIVYGRSVGDVDVKTNTCTIHGEHMTTYGTTKLHCDVIGLIGKTIQKIIWGEYRK